MGSDFYKNLNNAYKQISEEAGRMAVARARYRVQEDYNTELIKEIADKTDHDNLAAACFVDVDMDSDESLNVRAYHDWHVIEGFYNSRSSFHQRGGKWRSVEEHYGMHKDEFWERKENGDEGDKSYGVVDAEWIMDNFWDGVWYITNGWPRSDAPFLSVYPTHDISAGKIIESYHNRYVRSNRFQKYIQEEINMMKRK